jgi:hypothetical protein
VRADAGALDLMLEPDEGHVKFLLLLLDIAQIAGDRADQLLQSIKPRGDVVSDWLLPRT